MALYAYHGLAAIKLPLSLGNLVNLDAGINSYHIHFYLLSSGTVESQEQRLRFPALENLYLDHNELTDLSTFASLAGLRK